MRFQEFKNLRVIENINIHFNQELTIKEIIILLNSLSKVNKIKGKNYINVFIEIIKYIKTLINSYITLYISLCNSKIIKSFIHSFALKSLTIKESMDGLNKLQKLTVAFRSRKRNTIST